MGIAALLDYRSSLVEWLQLWLERPSRGGADPAKPSRVGQSAGCAVPLVSGMDRWICRFLDEDGSTRARSSMIADYMRPLRMLGRTSESAELAWRQLCVTCDPVVSGRGAADQLRRYLDQVEQALGPIPDDFPCAGCQECNSSDEIREARKSWADNVMSSALNVGSASGMASGQSGSELPRSSSGSGFNRRAGSERAAEDLGGSNEPFAEPPTAEELMVSQVTDADAGAAGPVVEEGGSALVGEGAQSESEPRGDRNLGAAVSDRVGQVARKVQVRTALRDLGQCVVQVAEEDDGRAVFAQVSAYLKMYFEDPPVPCKMFIGETVEEAEHLDVKDIFVHLFDEHEVPTVLCEVCSADSGDLSGVGSTPIGCVLKYSGTMHF